MTDLAKTSGISPPPRRKHTIAVHEAGHAVAAILHDIPFKYVTIIPAVVDAGPCGGHVRLKPPPARYRRGEFKDSPASLDFWHRRLIVNLAGPAAHKKLHPHAHPLGYAGADGHAADHVISDIHQSDGRNAVIPASAKTR